MTQPWSAEREVSAAFARSLIEDQFADLAPANVERFGAGWDNTAFVVNGTHVFRFPRREIAVPAMEAEIRWLPEVARELPLPAPVPTHVGRPVDAFPWPFAGYRKLEGRTACTAHLDENQRRRAAEPLGRFLAALHAVDVREVGPDTLGRLDLVKRAPRAHDQLDRLEDLGLIDDAAPQHALVDDAFARLAGSRAASVPAVVHGDLYARSLLVDGDGRLCGVIDWGDIHAGDPAIDLSIAHGFLPPAARPAFRAAYGPIDDATWMLARFRALSHATVVAIYGHEIDDDDLLTEGLLSLRHILSD